MSYSIWQPGLFDLECGTSVKSDAVCSGHGLNRNGKQEEVNVVFNMNDKKTRKIFSTIVIVLVVLAMVVPMILGSLLSIF